MFGTIAVVLSFNAILPLVPVIIIAILIIAAAGLTRGVDMFALLGLGSLIGLGGRAGGGVGKGGTGKGISGVKYKGDVIARGKATKKAGGIAAFSKAGQKKLKGFVKTKLTSARQNLQQANAAGSKGRYDIQEKFINRLPNGGNNAPGRVKMTVDFEPRSPPAPKTPGESSPRYSKNLIKERDAYLKNNLSKSEWKSYVKEAKAGSKTGKSAFYERSAQWKGRERTWNKQKAEEEARKGGKRERVKEQQRKFREQRENLSRKERNESYKDAYRKYFWGYNDSEKGHVKGVFEKGVIASGLAQWIRASRQKAPPTLLDNKGKDGEKSKEEEEQNKKQKTEAGKEQEAEEQRRNENKERAQKELSDQERKEREEQEQKKKDNNEDNNEA